MVDKELKHVGVLGMKWGQRKSSSSSSSSLSNRHLTSEEKRTQKLLDRKEKLLIEAIKNKRIKKAPDIHNLSHSEIAKITSSPVMSKKLKNYEKTRNRERATKIAGITFLGIVAANAFGPSIYNVGTKVFKFAQAKRYYDMMKKAEEYGGFDPKNVIDTKFL